ncbi:MAG: DUF5681 domain-containing protein [Dehalococcoidia bacterium]|nr:DUF5681 domain-containing protein [Dehalococcoidia bacterium]
MKGKSGNPQGRPKKAQSLQAHLERLLAEKGEGGKANRRLVAEALLEASLSGNIAAIHEVFLRIEGPVPIELRIHEIKIEVYTVVVQGFIALFNEANQLPDQEARRALFAIGADRLVAAGFPEQAEAQEP